MLHCAQLAYPLESSELRRAHAAHSVMLSALRRAYSANPIVLPQGIQQLQIVPCGILRTSRSALRCVEQQYSDFAQHCAMADHTLPSQQINSCSFWHTIHTSKSALSLNSMEHAPRLPGGILCSILCSVYSRELHVFRRALYVHLNTFRVQRVSCVPLSSLCMQDTSWNSEGIRCSKISDFPNRLDFPCVLRFVTVSFM